MSVQSRAETTYAIKEIAAVKTCQAWPMSAVILSRDCRPDSSTLSPELAAFTRDYESCNSTKAVGEAVRDRAGYRFAAAEWVLRTVARQAATDGTI